MEAFFKISNYLRDTVALSEAIIPIFSLIALGWVARRFSLISDRSTSILNSFAFYFALPALFFTSIYMMNFKVFLNTGLLFAVIIPILLSASLAFIYASVFRKDGKTKAAYVLGSFLGNNAYLAIPFISLSFGTAYEPITALIGAVYFSVGMVLNLFVLEYYSSKKKPRLGRVLLHVIRVPTIWGIVAGVAFSFIVTYYGVRMPLFAANTLSLIAAPASAIALFALGTFMYRKSKIDLKEVLTLCTFKNILLPVATFLLIGFFMPAGIDSKIVILQATMPMAVTNFVLAERYNVRRELISNAIVVSTIFSVLTLSAMTFILS